MAPTPDDRHTPTVIVARTAAPGRERQFQRWLKRLVDAASEAPGYVAADIQEPNALHPDEWVVVYRFRDADRLTAWLDSAERAALMAEGADLSIGDAREQVVALVREREPVTAVSSVRVRPGEEDAYRRLHQQVLERLQTFEGFLHSDLYEPVEGVQDDTVVVFAFDTREHLDRWLRSDQRREILEEMDQLVESGRTVNVVGGFAGWFGADGSEVKRWKQAGVVLLALFPTALGLTVLREALLPGLPLVPAVFVTNVAGVAILSWVLMPLLTRRLDGWLRR
jgi:uncharacterized protein